MHIVRYNLIVYVIDIGQVDQKLQRLFEVNILAGISASGECFGEVFRDNTHNNDLK